MRLGDCSRRYIKISNNSNNDGYLTVVFQNEFIVKSLPLVMDRLLQVLVNDSHPILVEEICENLQAMVCATHTSVRMFQTCVIRTFEADQTVVERLCQGLDVLTSTGAIANSNPTNNDQSLLDFISSISVETVS